jgi:hypothetical protein
MWLEPDPYYGPKDQSQDVRGREMEKKYTGANLSRWDKFKIEDARREAGWEERRAKTESDRGKETKE